MPQLRSRTVQVEKIVKTESPIKKTPVKKKNPKTIIQTFTAIDEDIETVHEYPTTQRERNEYVNHRTGKKVTPFQYKVYDLVRQIPSGHVTSYKILSDTLKASPRAVGQALRINPFAPLPIPCHRVIATNYTIGGFSGGSGDHQNTANKKAKLIREGCLFNQHYMYQSNTDGTHAFYSNFFFI